MAGRRFIIRVGDPALREKDPVTQKPFILGEEAIDCGRHHYFHVESWQEVNGVCPLDQPVISPTRKGLAQWQRLIVYSITILFTIMIVLMCAGVAISVSQGTISFISGLFPTATATPKSLPTSTRLPSNPTPYPTYTLMPTSVPTSFVPPPTIPPTRAGPPSCGTSVGSSFARIWNDPSFYQRLGCSTGAEFQSESAVESFEKGFMVWRGNGDRVYAIYNNGTWDGFPKGPSDMFREGRDPEYSCGPNSGQPSSPPYPRRGFSKVWCNNSDVQIGLGYAIEYEQGFCMPGGGACETFQDFANGIMYRNTKFGAVFVLFADKTWQRR
jgi:hypothetical protein